MSSQRSMRLIAAQKIVADVDRQSSCGRRQLRQPALSDRSCSSPRRRVASRRDARSRARRKAAGARPRPSQELANADSRRAASSFAAATSPLFRFAVDSAGYSSRRRRPGIVFAPTPHTIPRSTLSAPHGLTAVCACHSVVRAPGPPDARCGIGLTLQPSDGHGWTYCPPLGAGSSVVREPSLKAGDPVGLSAPPTRRPGPTSIFSSSPPSPGPIRRDGSSRSPNRPSPGRTRRERRSDTSARTLACSAAARPRPAR